MTGEETVGIPEVYAYSVKQFTCVSARLQIEIIAADEQQEINDSMFDDVWTDTIHTHCPVCNAPVQADREAGPMALLSLVSMAASSQVVMLETERNQEFPNIFNEATKSLSTALYHTMSALRDYYTCPKAHSLHDWITVVFDKYGTVHSETGK